MRVRGLPAVACFLALVVGCATTDSVLPGWEEEDDTSSSAGPGGGDGGSTPTDCGDGVCVIEESPESCPEDCIIDPCGDDLCDADEDCDTCPADCGACGPSCGDDVCDASEDCDSCEADCGVCSCVDDTFEPNQGSSTSKPLASGVDYCDVSVCAGDVDWFRFDGVSGSLSVQIDFFHADGDLDLEIYSGINGNYVSGSYTKNDDELVSLSGLASGTYWARVYGYGHTAQGGGDENWAYCIRATY